MSPLTVEAASAAAAGTTSPPTDDAVTATDARASEA